VVHGPPLEGALVYTKLTKTGSAYSAVLTAHYSTSLLQALFSRVLGKVITRGGEKLLEIPPCKNVLGIVYNYWTLFKKCGPPSENSSPPWRPKLVTTWSKVTWMHPRSQRWHQLHQVFSRFASIPGVLRFDVGIFNSFGK